MKFHIFYFLRRGKIAKTKAFVSTRPFVGGRRLTLDLPADTDQSQLKRAAGESICPDDPRMVDGELIPAECADPDDLHNVCNWTGFTLCYRHYGERHELLFTSRERDLAESMFRHYLSAARDQHSPVYLVGFRANSFEILLSNGMRLAAA